MLPFWPGWLVKAAEDERLEQLAASTVCSPGGLATWRALQQGGV